MFPTEAAQAFLVNSTDPTALSPFERRLFKSRGIPIAQGEHGVWRLTVPVDRSTELARANRASDEFCRLESYSDAQLQPFSRSSDPATRTAAIRILDQRSRQQSRNTRAPHSPDRS